MKAATKLTTKGQVVIPKPIRDHLKWRPGTRLELTTTDDQTVVLGLGGADPIDAAFGFLAGGDPIGDLEEEHRAEVESDGSGRS